MDMHQIFMVGETHSNFDSDLSHDSNSFIPEWVTKLDFELGNSSDFTSPSNSQDQSSSPDNLSGISPIDNSSFDTDTTQPRFSNNQEQQEEELRSRLDSVLVRHVLREIETVLMSPDINEDDEGTTLSGGVDHGNGRPGPISSQPHKEQRVTQQKRSSHGFKAEKRHRLTEEPMLYQENPKGNLKKLLIDCARALSENRIFDFDKQVEYARSVVSIRGEPIQRLGAYMVEGLVARKNGSGTNIYQALNCRVPESSELLSYMRILYELCPYMKFGYMAANGAIAEAFKNEDRVHIIDFQIGQGTQWMTLIQALAARPSGPPHVRITGIDDPVSKHARGDGLEALGKSLAAMSQKFKIPVEFHAVPVFASDITKEMLNVKPGEALAVNFPLQLHHTADESVDVKNPRDGLLRMVKSLSPKVVTLIEQESNTNTTPFLTRFVEALEFYSAMFESIDANLPRDKRERINVEQQCLARDIVNVIACEGKERVERHELLGKWKLRFEMAGFKTFPLSSHVNSVIKTLLKNYSDDYTLVEKDGAMLLGWKDRNLISASAWH